MFLATATKSICSAELKSANTDGSAATIKQTAHAATTSTNRISPNCSVKKSSNGFSSSISDSTLGASFTYWTADQCGWFESTDESSEREDKYLERFH